MANLLATHSFYKLIMIFAILQFFQLPNIYSQLQECCFIPACEQQAKSYAEHFNRLAPLLGAPPSTREDAIGKLEILKMENPRLFDEFNSLIKKYDNWVGEDGFKSVCFRLKLPDDADAISDWVVEARSLRVKSSFRSSQFCRGFRFRLEGGLGAADLASSTENFNASVRALIAYTFAPSDPAASGSNEFLSHCNGRFRLLAGLSENYISQRGVLQGLARIEFRLFDLYTSLLGPFGNGKILLQGSEGITRDLTSFGAGFGIETEFIEVFLLYERHLEIADHSLQVNLGYKL